MRVEVYEEPNREQYAGILKFACDLGGSFSLVWQDQLSFDDSATLVQRALEPHLLRESRTSTWPGTCTTCIATVRFYPVNPDTICVLGEAHGILAWRAPDRPEDLAIYDSEGHCWLESTAHEGDMFVNLSEHQLARLRGRVPNLKLYFLDGAPRDGA